MRKVRVALEGNGYDIFIGENLTEQLHSFLRQAGFSRKALVISDENVSALYGDTFLLELKNAGLEPEMFAVSAGEQAKSFAVAEKIYTKAIEMGLDRKAAIFALGGGVVGDLAGFIAATYLRGVSFVQVPTSLLAQVDSSVGGKVAINHPLGKNLIGAFYQPRAVFIDLNRLCTLPEREVYTGLAEIIKYGVIYDESFFSYLKAQANEILNMEQAALQHIIARSCEIKAAVVSQDEKETGLRIILNFGHTIAHAVESETGYSVYNHGEAVAIGMYGAARLSCYLGLIAADTVREISNLIERFHLPLKAKDCSVERLHRILSRDKKAVGGSVQWVLAESIGRVKTKRDVPPELVKRVLEEIIA